MSLPSAFLSASRSGAKRWACKGMFSTEDPAAPGRDRPNVRSPSLRGLVDQEPVQAEPAHRFGERIEVHRLHYVAVRSEAGYEPRHSGFLCVQVQQPRNF